MATLKSYREIVNESRVDESKQTLNESEKLHEVVLQYTNDKSEELTSRIASYFEDAEDIVINKMKEEERRLILEIDGSKYEIAVWNLNN